VDELGRVALLRSIYGGGGGDLTVGIGDDAAVLRAPAGQQLVWTVDDQVEGTHFERAWLSAEDVGWRATMAAASDVAAMGARPLGILSSLVLPPAFRDDELAALARGVRGAADALGTGVAGGNLARGPALILSTTVLGCVAAPVLRAGARAGDAVWLAGQVGKAGAGLRLLVAGKSCVAGDAAAAIAAWRRPVARTSDGLAMAAGATAAIDVSDGLARDGAHLARASGVALVLDAVPLLTPALLALSADEDDALALALGGGEDYALLATSSSPLPGFTRVGEVRAGAGVFLNRRGVETPVADVGFDHFARGGRAPETKP